MNSLLEKVTSFQDLTFDEMKNLMNQIMTGKISSNVVSAFITALAMKGETVDEISAAAQVLRENFTSVNTDKNVVDTCGTGGDGLKTFNISTCASFVAAGAGVKIAKHGGRSVSSSSGSADVLERLGVNVSIDHVKMKELVEHIGIGFMFAPNFHPAMKNVAPIRKELGIRTIFNILGPLSNPANAKRQVIGVFKKSLTYTFAEVLKNLGSLKVLVVHGEDGMDEISMSAKTFVSELNGGIIKNYEIQPEDFGLKRYGIEYLFADDVQSSKDMIIKILNDEDIPAKNIVLLNAAAAIYVSDITNNFRDAIDVAQNSIKSGKALMKLDELIKESNG